MDGYVRELAKGLACRLGELEKEVEAKARRWQGVSEAGEEMLVLRQRIAVLRNRLKRLQVL